MGLLALSIDGLLYVMTSVNTNWRLGRLVVFLLVLSLGLTNVWQAVMTRQTNVDLIAEEIEGRISKRDLIIVNPWFLGITFLRYHSKGDWETLPRLNDHRITQYEEIKKIMTKVDPIVKDLNRMALVLKGGGDIWWVGNLPPYVPGLTSDPLPPAPLPETGWREGPYHEDWSKQARDMFHQHGCRITKNASHNQPTYQLVRKC